jgi:hypothetical protein
LSILFLVLALLGCDACPSWFLICLLVSTNDHVYVVLLGSYQWCSWDVLGAAGAQVSELCCADARCAFGGFVYLLLLCWQHIAACCECAACRCTPLLVHEVKLSFFFPWNKLRLEWCISLSWFYFVCCQVYYLIWLLVHNRNDPSLSNGVLNHLSWLVLRMVINS